METAIIGARVVQYLAAVVLFGSPLFLICGLDPATAAAARWTRPLFGTSAGLVLAGAIGSLLSQTAAMAGDARAALDPAILSEVLAGSAFGTAIILRLAAAAGALVTCLAVRRGAVTWPVLTALGAIVLASFAWTGHGAAEDGPLGQVHAAADILHLLAAGVWLGSLLVLATLLILARPDDPPQVASNLAQALAGFSAIGSITVAVILATGLVNSWFLVGPSRVGEMLLSTYGQLLLLKLALFVAMLGLAAANRFRLTPGLARAITENAPRAAIIALRRSVMIEAGLGVAILAIVAVIGTLAPVSAQ